jgi:valyl-tRNA synthetase
LIDPEKERQRLSKQLSEKQKLMQLKESKLANESFISRAPAEIVQQEREAIADLKRQIEMIQENLRDLSDS